jgi:hypothetical protein
MRRDDEPVHGNFTPRTSPARTSPPPPRPEGGRRAASLVSTRGAEEGEARIAFRDGEAKGAIEILSFDASGQCVVHVVAGLALLNLNLKCAEAIRRGAVR